VGQTRPLPRALVRRLGLVTDAAVEVLKLVEGGPAARAGVRSGDWIVSIADAPVRSADDLQRLLAGWPSGRSAALGLVRAGARLSLEVRPQEAPAA
jgi:S1-C subfamily serine protease